MRWHMLAVPVLLLSCAKPPQTAWAAPGGGDAACRAAPDGAPDGAPASRPQRAERGIGGTGGRVADRGIGGTGIIGTITGFASICVNGIEIAFDPTAAIEVDDATASTDALRAGQLAVITAQGAPRALDATDIAIRHEVVGPVEGVRPGGLTVAGQAVIVPASAWVMGVQGAAASVLHGGDWVEVSGLRRPDGGIVASRIDAHAQGTILVRGVLSGDAAAPRIGDLPLRLAPGIAMPTMRAVTVTGRPDGASLIVATLAPDPAMGMPTTAFGAARHLVIESIVRLDADHVTFADGETAPRRAAATAAPPSFDPASSAPTVVELERGSDGAFSVARLGEPPRLGPRTASPPQGGPSQGGPPQGDPAASPMSGRSGGPPVH